MMSNGLNFFEFLFSVKDLEPGIRDGNGKYGRYVHGKINMPDTAHMRSNHSNRIVCEFDEFSKNNIYNRVIKTIAKLLLRPDSVKEKYKDILTWITIHQYGILPDEEAGTALTAVPFSSWEEYRRQYRHSRTNHWWARWDMYKRNLRSWIPSSLRFFFKTRHSNSFKILPDFKGFFTKYSCFLFIPEKSHGKDCKNCGKADTWNSARRNYSWMINDLSTRRIKGVCQS